MAIPHHALYVCVCVGGREVDLYQTFSNMFIKPEELPGIFLNLFGVYGIYTLHGTGTGTGTGIQWVILNYAEVFTLLRDRDRDLKPLCPIVPIPFPVPVPVPIPGSVYIPLGTAPSDSIVLLLLSRTVCLSYY